MSLMMKPKRCRCCGQLKRYYEFPRKGRQPKDWCYCCWKDNRKQHRDSDWKMAKRMWNNICQRANNKSGNHPAYAKIEVRMEEHKFLYWAVAELPHFRYRFPGKRPSIDRIAGDGHYELSNLQLIPVGENSRKRSCCVSLTEAGQIRRLYRTGHYIYRQLAHIFNTSIATISRIVNYRTHTA